MSHIGVCCSFNYNPTNSSYNPLRVNSYGVRGGLSIISTSFPHLVDGSSGSIFSNGYILFMHPAYDFPNDGTSMALLQVGKITSIAIYPTISISTADVIALPLKSRKCLTGHDFGSTVYSRAACTSNCLTRFIYDKCECHPYFIPTPLDPKLRQCTALDGDCFQKIFCKLLPIRFVFEVFTSRI